MMAENRPGTMVWCMGGTQHTIGNNNTRAYCVLQLALGNVGKSGGGANIFRGHDNVQGATDLGVLSHTLPGYYGLAEGAWKHWARVWDLDLEWVKSQFSQEMVEDDGGDGPSDVLPGHPGVPLDRWRSREEPANMGQKDRFRAMILWGHAVNSQTRGPEMKKAMEQLDMMVVVDPLPDPCRPS
jgi:formate dehydrogenase major subunit